jgi:hypothetical protein
MKIGDRVKVVKTIMVPDEIHLGQTGVIVNVWGDEKVSVKFEDDSPRLFLISELEIA